MNTGKPLIEPSKVKEALCSHFKVAPATSELTVQEKQFIGMGGDDIHYFYFTLASATGTHRAFGKVAARNEHEYRALEYLVKTVPPEQRHIGLPIALLKQNGHPLLLLEYLEGASNALTIANSLRLFPNRSLSISRTGKDILDKFYGLQNRANVVYRSLSPEDIKKTPGQPVPTGVLNQLEAIRSLSPDAKDSIRECINKMVAANIPARRGIVHGALGMRNVMMGRSSIAFIDWEFMEYEGLSVYDPCYLATMLLMKSVQLLVSHSKLDLIHDSLYDHIEYLEEGIADAAHKPYVKDCVWFGRILATVDTLWQYEQAGHNGMASVVTREQAKINFLSDRITRDAELNTGTHTSVESRRSHWTHYVQDSKRRSSSAEVTADTFIRMGGITPGTRMADLGCGHGRITELVVERVPSLDIVGVDMTQHLLDNFMVKPGTNGVQLQLIPGDVTKLPLRDCDFDVAVTSRVFQYLPNPLLAVREAMRILKPGGTLVVSIPNKWNPIRFFNYKHKLYSPFEVSDWLKQCGFEDVECGSICFFPSSVGWRGVSSAAELAGKVPVIRYLGGNVYVVGRKAKSQRRSEPTLTAAAA